MHLAMPKGHGPGVGAVNARDDAVVNALEQPVRAGVVKASWLRGILAHLDPHIVQRQVSNRIAFPALNVDLVFALAQDVAEANSLRAEFGLLRPRIISDGDRLGSSTISAARFAFRSSGSKRSRPQCSLRHGSEYRFRGCCCR